MAVATYSVAVMVRGRLNLVGAMSFTRRSRTLWGIADDMTKFSAVCLYQMRNTGSCAVNFQPSPRGSYLRSYQLVCDKNLRQSNLYISPYQQPSRILSVAPYTTRPDRREREQTTPPVTTSEREIQSDAGKSDSPSTSTKSETEAAGAVPEEQLTLFQRFKKAYKEHGKILVAVHVATSIVWFGSFFTAAHLGVDIVPLMEKWGFSETFIKPFRAGGLGEIALAYLMYKLATPARYTVTLAGTNFAIRYLRSKGKMAPKSQEDSLRQLYKEGRLKLKDSKLRTERLQRIRAARKKKQEAGKKPKKA